MQKVAVDVRQLDVEDDAQMRQWYDVTKVADTFERPWAVQWSFEEMTVQIRAEDEATRWILTGAFDGEQMVGAALHILPLLDNTEKVYGGIYVAPASRDQGIGRALVESTVALMRLLGRTTLLVNSAMPLSERETHPYTRFARRHGFTMANVEVHRVLDLPIDTRRLEAMRDDAARHHRGYDIRTFEDAIPDDLLPSYVHLLNQLAVDAPTGEIDFEEEAMTPEIYRQHMERTRRQGRHKVVSIAVSPDGEAVAHSDLVVPRADLPNVYQWGTLVRRDHRGHHLGAAVKVANILALQRRYPERTQIHTTNSEVNDTMIGINERLGFRVVEIEPEFLLTL
ncbi:MAG TPA: GNAT family N-acetyltransferase [Nocardioidaceae bacterium]